MDLEFNNCVGCIGGTKLNGGDDNNITVQQDTPTCDNPNGLCGACCDVFTNADTRAKFGITREQAYCHCRDICIQEVRAMCAQDIDFTMSIPTSTGSINCRGEYNPGDPPFDSCQVLVTCAREELIPGCTGTNIWVGFQIILTCTSVIPTTRLVINVTKSFTCTSFYAFPEGTAVNVPEMLKLIDGSQLVIQDLECEILDSTDPRVRITGKLVDKLWKEDNLWVQAIRPYGGITVKQEFAEPHKIGLCTI